MLASCLSLLALNHVVSNGVHGFTVVQTDNNNIQRAAAKTTKIKTTTTTTRRQDLLLPRISLLTVTTTTLFEGSSESSTESPAEDDIPPAISSSPSSATLSSWRDALEWVQDEPLEALLPKQDAAAIITELLDSETLTKESQQVVLKYWQSLEKRLKEEKRSLGEILGPETTNSVLKSVGDINVYDSQTVRAFLGSKAVNSLFAKVLYDGIFEFFQRIDVFGNIVNSLPIIGPIRKQIVAETRRQLDQSLGPLVQNFLQSYTKVAVTRAADYVLSPSNTARFGKANQQVASVLLKRPLNSLVLAEGLGEKLIQDYYSSFQDLDASTINRYLDIVYDLLGDKSLSSSAGDVNRIVQASPTLEKTLDRLWDKAATTTAKTTTNDGS